LWLISLSSVALLIWFICLVLFYFLLQLQCDYYNLSEWRPSKYCCTFHWRACCRRRNLPYISYSNIQQSAFCSVLLFISQAFSNLLILVQGFLLDSKLQPLFEVVLTQPQNICSIAEVYWIINGVPSLCDPICISCSNNNYFIPHRFNLSDLMVMRTKEFDVRLCLSSANVRLIPSLLWLKILCSLVLIFV
jgi:hypothetical protein